MHSENSGYTWVEEESLKECIEGHRSIAKIGIALTIEKNIHRLFEMIVDEAMNLSNAEGGTLYIVDDDKKHLRFVVLQNKVLNTRLGGTTGQPIDLPRVSLYVDGKPNHSNVSSYVALTGHTVNIPDVYEADGFDFSGTKKYDQMMGYRSRSMLVTPMMNNDDEIVGVLQVINAKDKFFFSKAYIDLLAALASQAAVALTNTKLSEELRLYAKELEISNKKLEEYNKNLEEKVAERTHVLALKNEELEVLNTKLNELNATKDKFFSIISHDLKGPFNVLLGFSKLLKENYDTLNDEKRRKYINRIYESSDNSFKLLENLLSWSRMQTNKMPFTPQKHSLNDIVTENILLLQSVATTKGIMLSSHLPNNVAFFGDANMVMMVVRNLISNAIKFTGLGGSVDVYHMYVDNGFNLITIADSGIGMKKEDKEKLFRIDVHHSTAGTANEQGTGLGLIMCKEFVERNNGKIWVESEEGKGSRFSFTLPVHECK